MSYYPPQQYQPQGYGYQQQQSPPYPDHFPGEAYPPSQSYSAPPQQQYSAYPPPAQQREQTWDPKQVYAQYGAGTQQQPQQDNRGLGDFFSGQQQHLGQEGERGIGATLLGGAGGAFLGHEMGHGKIATLGGLAIGAIAANAFEHHHEKKKHEREEMRAYDSGYVNGEDRRRGIEDYERSRGVDDDYEEERYYDEERPRHHHHHRAERDYDDEEEYVEDRDRDGDYQVEDYYRRDY